MPRRPPAPTLFPYTTLFRSVRAPLRVPVAHGVRPVGLGEAVDVADLRADRFPLREQRGRGKPPRSEEHTSELQSRQYLVCRLLLEKKKQHNGGRVTHDHDAT